VIVVTAKGQDFNRGIILDNWRYGGRLVWGPLVEDPHYQWHENKPQFQSEKEYLEKKGIRLERIPVKLGGWPTKKDVDRFFEIVNDPQAQPVLVHCAQGVRRTGFMAAAYQMKQLGYDKDRAKESILRFGHSDRTANDVIRFIDGYDPATGTVPENLMPSNE